MVLPPLLFKPREFSSCYCGQANDFDPTLLISHLKAQKTGKKQSQFLSPTPEKRQGKYLYNYHGVYIIFFFITVLE